ncbi:hypothetical protein [Actinomadura macra]|uniref:hypothetical protein n=1 Tax=Actinomadura macra TaxID=46164 RepID=UPI000834B195|nr:hypothetical protein [Actinomadura macra]
MTAVRVRVVEGRQVATGTGLHGAGTELEIDDRLLLRRWVAWGWVVPVEGDEVPTRRPGPAARHHRANVRARIREELATDHTRSDRAVATVVGCDHKTVGAVRSQMHDRGELPHPSGP